MAGDSYIAPTVTGSRTVSTFHCHAMVYFLFTVLKLQPYGLKPGPQFGTVPGRAHGPGDRGMTSHFGCASRDRPGTLVFFYGAPVWYTLRAQALYEPGV
jgi:hypothetical protein